MNDDAIDDIRYDIDDYDVCWWSVDRIRRSCKKATQPNKNLSSAHVTSCRATGLLPSYDTFHVSPTFSPHSCVPFDSTYSISESILVLKVRDLRYHLSLFVLPSGSSQSIYSS